MNLDGLASCAELTNEIADEAASSSSAMRELLAWVARVARPSDGAPKVLMAIARLAKAPWVEGTIVVEISGTSAECFIAFFSDHGMGIRERVLPQTRLGVPVEELARAIRLAPQLIAPLSSHVEDGKHVLTLPEAEDELASTRELIAIDDKSLHEQERKTAPPPAEVAISEKTTARPPQPDEGVHTHPTVRRMVAVRPEALRSGNDDE